MVEEELVLYSSYCRSPPWWVRCILDSFWPPQPFSEGDNISTLRQSILAATGGVLAILTLGENRRKNIQEKEKNDQDHTRQVHAERRVRYAKAIEQLADEKAPIRLGGVYTLAKLVDEWLADEKTLPSEEERRQEGQIIIDSLCAYIRSSFPLAERYELTLSYEEYQQNHQGNQDLHSPQVIPLPKPKNAKQSREEFVRDKSLFQEEQEVRKTILLEIKNRLNGGTTKNKDGRDEIKPGTWSYFEYDFSNAVFFYDVNFNEVNFSGKKTSFLETKFTQKAEFSGSIFNEITDFSEDADFSWAHFHSIANFSGAHFHKVANFSCAHFHSIASIANFSGTHFHKVANFSWAHFHSIANFSGTHFHRDAAFSEKYDFSGAHFHKVANFSWAKFTGNAGFSEVGFTNAHFSEAKFTGDADFSMAEFTNAHFLMAKFTRDAHFSEAKFTNANFSMAKFTNANFSKAKFTRDAHFFDAEFTGSADFSMAEFTGDAHFSIAEFTGNADFSGATFEEKPIFERALGDKTYKARFSYKADSKDYNFEVSPDSPYKIETKEQEHNGIKFVIPEDAELFDPDEPSE